MLTDQRVEAIFQEMDELVIELESDASSMGPQYFQDLIATCRNYLNRVGLVLNELNRERMSVGSEVRRLEAAYELEYDDLLANDQTIKDLGSIEDRKAAAGWRLREQRAALNEARARQHELNAVHKVVAFRNKELHATMAAIRDQKRLMASEIRSGSFYGDERPAVLRPGEDDGGGISAEELSAIMTEAEQLACPAADLGVAPAEVDVLDKSENQAAVREADATTRDLDDLFNNV